MVILWGLLIIVGVKIGLGGYNLIQGLSNEQERTVTSPIQMDDEKGDKSSEGSLENTPKYLTGALIGLDASGFRTDVMMVGVLNLETYDIDMFSIPRDTKIELNDTLYDELNENSWTPRIMKLTELYYYVETAGKDHPIYYTLDAIEQLLDLKIDHYVIIDPDSFDEVVDTIGGVELYVPRDMNYDDDVQNLHIHLKKGLQVLDGEKAEQLVRFRKDNYNQGYDDFGRMEIQQYFVKGFLESLLQVKNLFRIKEITESIVGMVQTDVDILDALKYLQYLDHLQLEYIESHILPGESQKVDGLWYVVLESDDVLHEFVKDALKHKKQEKEKNKINIWTEGKNKKIVENYTERLEKDGYEVAALEDFDGEQRQKTQIIVHEEGTGQTLLPYFKLAEIQVDPEEVEEGNIVIILGELEK